MPLREILITYSVALAAVAVILTLVYSVRRRQTRLDRALAEQATIHAQLEEAYKIARVVDWRWVPSTGTVTLSSSARDVFGTTWTSAGAGVRLVHPDDREHVEATFREALRHDGSYTCTSRLIRPDTGQVRWFEHRGRIHRDADGGVTQVNGVSIDVTERQQAVEAAAAAERVAHESLAELEAVLESVPAVVWVARDTECRTVTGSRAAYESLRVPLGRNLSKTAPAPERPTNFRVCHADGREYAPEELPLQRAAATGEPQRGVRTDILFDDGTRQVLYGNAHPLKDAAGRVTGAVAGFVDITPLIESETALAQSEALSRALGEAAPDFVWVTDRSGNPLCVNPRWSEYTGLSLEDLRSQGWQSVIHSDDHATLSVRWAQAARDGTGFDAEFRYRRLDGEYRWFWGRAVPLRDATGQTEKWVGTSTDIHERKMAEDILRETERQYRETAGELETIIELAPIGLVVARDSACAVITSNPYAARLFGVPPGTNISASAAAAERLPYVIRRRDAIVPPDDMPLQKAMRTGEPQLDDVLELVKPDGSRADVIVSGVPLKDDAGRVRGAIGTIQDVTAFNVIQKQLSDSEERLRLAVEGADLGMWETDLRTGLTHNNARNLAIFGFEPESEPVAGARWLDVIHPDDVETVLATWASALSNRDPYQLEYRIVRPDGVERWVESKARFHLDGSGEPARVIGISSDITERKEVEDALRNANLRKDEFLATLAHELRNPLAPIRYASRLFRAGTPPDMVEDAGRMVERQLAHMSRLLDDLLDVSRITRGALELRREVLDLRSVVNSAVEAARPLAESVDHRLEVRLPSSALPVHGDVTRLTQAIGNLLNNATRYTDPGGLIVIEASATAAEVVVAVHDNGIGISRELLPRLFELFTQGDRSGRATSGLGIGLALARRLVELHGGQIEASSAGPGQGSRFTIRLPRATEVPAIAQSVAAPERIAVLGANGMRVLIVDDNADAADSLAQLLEVYGYTTKVAYDGASALEIAGILRPGIVLLDLGLPDLSGHQVAQRMRTEAWGAAAKIIAVTGWGQESDRRKTRDAGFDEHLTKPVDPEVLLRLVAQATRGAA